uniref:Neural proliferation differentiation and control protein 1 n=1 Tax=Cacopsylla melanoneura TaxID=428564 RepID=A0A8D9AN00_9HEMI
MLSMNFVLCSIVLCFVVADVELYPGSFGSSYSSFSSGLLSATQDEEDLYEEERDSDAEYRIIAKLAQIIQHLKLKYTATPPPPAPNPAFVPDFTYHFPQIDLNSVDISSVPFAVRPNNPLYYQKDFSSHIKNQQPGAQEHNDPTVQNQPEISSLQSNNYHSSLESNPRPARPQPMKPMMILVKDDNEHIDEAEEYRRHRPPVPPQRSPHDYPHKGHPKWIGVNEDVSEGETDETDETPMVYYTEKPHYDDNMVFVGLVGGCSAALLFMLTIGIYFWYKLQRNSKLGADVKYPAAYSVGGVIKNGTPPNSGDRRLAHSAQMYHYQHQKQQILALENNTRDQRRGSVSDVDSDDENEADHTVYECPTLPLTNKKTPDLEVKKPTVEKKPTPSLPSSNNSEDTKKPNSE